MSQFALQRSHRRPRHTRRARRAQARGTKGRRLALYRLQVLSGDVWHKDLVSQPRRVVPTCRARQDKFDREMRKMRLERAEWHAQLREKCAAKIQAAWHTLLARRVAAEQRRRAAARAEVEASMSALEIENAKQRKARRLSFFLSITVQVQPRPQYERDAA